MFDSRANETEEAEMVKLTTIEDFLKVEIELVVHHVMGKPFTNDLLLHTHNML